MLIRRADVQVAVFGLGRKKKKLRKEVSFG